jgi:trimethylamine--corrinoid protein Co-methyltransferase
MAILKTNFLTKSEEDFVHATSIKSLETIGVLVRSEPVAKMLASNGAQVDSKGIVKIPESMVNEALKKAPKEFTLCARDPKNDMKLPVDGAPFVSTDGLDIYMRDFETGKKRNATRKDLGNFAKLADALDGIDFFWPIVTASDAPTENHMVHEMWTSLLNCTMHVQGDVASAHDAIQQVKLASLVVGGEKELKKRPIFSMVNCPIAPLSFEKGAVEAQVELAKAGIPIVAMSMSLSGMSSPVTVGGTIVNANTENLASLVITEFAAPGAPHIFSSESSPIDMATGNINYSAPEMPLISTAIGEMSRRYGRPCMVGGWGLGGEKSGVESGLLDMVSTALSVLTGTDLVTGLGSLDDAKGTALEQLVIDSYLWEEMKGGFIRNISIDERTAALDVVKQVGQGNSFLTHPHTAKNFRKELFFFNDEHYDWWASTTSDSMVPEAKKIVKKLLKEHTVPEVDRSIVKEGDDYIKKYEKEILGIGKN